MTHLFRRLAAVSLATALSLPGVVATAQPALPRDRARRHQHLRALVDRLYSPDAKERAEAACQIGRRGATAAAAIPVLLSMLSDDVTVPALECEMSPWLRRTLPDESRRCEVERDIAGKEAAEALGDIGNASVPGLLQALSHSDWKTRKFAAIGLGEVDHIEQLPDRRRRACRAADGCACRGARPECVGTGRNRGCGGGRTALERLARPRSPSSRAGRVGLGRD